jgi:hypothetical protein
MTFKADTKELKQFERDLYALNKRGFPYAIKNSLDALAFDARKEWQGEIRSEMTLRNKFTEGSIRVEKASGNNLQSMRSVVGSIAPYMATQEHGGDVKGKSGNKAIPTDSARSGKSHSRLVTRPNKMARIQLAARKGKTQKQRNAIQVSEAKRTGSKFAYLEVGAKRGIFRVTGGKRRSRLELIQSLTHTVAKVPKNPTMVTAVERAVRGVGSHYRKALVFQLEKARTWKR